jgi:hypothetical protein
MSTCRESRFIDENEEQYIGAWSDQKAAAHLFDQGCEIQDRNVRIAHGEIDQPAEPGHVIFLLRGAPAHPAGLPIPKSRLPTECRHTYWPPSKITPNRIRLTIGNSTPSQLKENKEQDLQSLIENVIGRS